MSSSGLKCDACGSTDIDVDPSRADAVCTSCGNVLESSIIVSDIQFEENAQGGSSAIGTFVSSENKGGNFASGGGLGGSRGPGQFQGCIGRESREITLRNARKKIEALSHQLSLRRDRIDMAFHFFKLALSRGLTRGRKSTHVIAACVYITCRTESLSHMLIDFSDVLQIDVYELSRTYMRLSQALHINIPAIDPCLYVMRFAHTLEFGDKTHEVSMTALRLVSRMKKDWMHFGRRPSGLCGAALLIASRLHSFRRNVVDIVKVVKVHESTLRKRLNEFGETQASQLTLDEFMNVDLDAMTEEQDPPSFKAARRKDKERLTLLEEKGTAALDDEISTLQLQIERELDKMRAKYAGPYAKYARVTTTPTPSSEKVSNDETTTEEDAMETFIAEETLSTIHEVVSTANNLENTQLMPPPPPPPTSSSLISTKGLGLKDTIQEYLMPDAKKKTPLLNNDESSDVNGEDSDCELDLTGIDDNEIDGYLMTPQEIEFKTQMWMTVNAEYLEAKAEKDRLEAERQGIDVKKRSKTRRKNVKSDANNATALEAIEKIVQEKKISNKINYDVLRSLASSPCLAKSDPPTLRSDAKDDDMFTHSSLGGGGRLAKKRDLSLLSSTDVKDTVKIPSKKTLLVTTGENVEKKTFRDSVSDTRELVVEDGPVAAEQDQQLLHDEDLDFDDEDEDEESTMTAAQLLSQHRGDGEDAMEDDGYLEECF